MNINIGLNPVGITLALVFIVVMSLLFRWMFHTPPLLAHRVVMVRRSVSSLRRILVPTIDHPASERAVELACRLAGPQRAEIVLTYIIEVPFILPLDAPMPEAQQRAEQALADANQIVALHGLKARSRTLPARNAGDGIIRVAKEEGADIIVLSLPPQRWPRGGVIGSTAEILLRRAPCEVLLDKMPT